MDNLPALADFATRRERSKVWLTILKQTGYPVHIVIIEIVNFSLKGLNNIWQIQNDSQRYQT